MFEGVRTAIANLISPAAAPTQVRMLEGGSGKRWQHTPPFGPLPTEVMAGANRVRGRARHLRHNDPLASNATSIYKTGLVGFGVTCAAQHDDAETRATIDAAFAEWATETNFAELQAEMVDAFITDGESLLIMRTDDNGRLRLQHIPCDLLDESMTLQLSNGGYIASGVEFDAQDEIVGYHIRRTKLTDVFATSEPPVRIDAADVLHVFRRQGAGQHRGLSLFAPVILPLNELSQLHDALLVSAKVQAMLTGFVQDLNGTGTAFADGQQAADIMNISLEPGTMRVLPSGYTVTFSNPSQMRESVDFAGHSIRLIAAGLQIPEFLLSGDMRNVNYSSARTALVQWRAHLEQIQFGTLAPRFFDPIFRRWMTLESLSGRLPVDSELVGNPNWYFPKPQWVDPAKDAAATLDMMRGGLMSRRQAVAELGFNVETLDAEIAKDRERESSLGLNFEASQISKKEPTE